MHPEAKNFLRLAITRNESIPKILQSGVHLEPNPLRVRRARGLFPGLIRSMKIEGRDNIERARQMAEGKLPAFVFNHTSDFDAPTFRMALEELGQGEMANRLLYPAGMKMLERFYISHFFPTEHACLVATPFDLRDIEKALTPIRSGWHDYFSKTQIGVIEEYHDNCNKLNSLSFQTRSRLMQEEGLVTAIYPEATRSRDGFLQRAPQEVGVYFRHASDIVVPVAMVGMERILPPKNIAQCLLTMMAMYMGGLIKTDINVTIGEPFFVREMSSWHKRVKAAPGVNRVDYVMARIAELIPDRVRGADRAYYRGILHS